MFFANNLLKLTGTPIMYPLLSYLLSFQNSTIDAIVDVPNKARKSEFDESTGNLGNSCRPIHKRQLNKYFSRTVVLARLFTGEEQISFVLSPSSLWRSRHYGSRFAIAASPNRTPTQTRRIRGPQRWSSDACRRTLPLSRLASPLSCSSLDLRAALIFARRFHARNGVSRDHGGIYSSFASACPISRSLPWSNLVYTVDIETADGGAGAVAFSSRRYILRAIRVNPVVKDELFLGRGHFILFFFCRLFLRN